MSFDSTIHAKAVQLAKRTYEITAAAGSGHPTGNRNAPGARAIQRWDQVIFACKHADAKSEVQ